MAARSSEADHLAARLVRQRKLPRSAENLALTCPLRRQLAVIAPSVGEAVRHAGGWLFDLVWAGWDGVVITAEQADPAPARILGARAFDLGVLRASPLADRSMHAIVVEANLYNCDARVRRLVQQVSCPDLTELMLCGGDLTRSLHDAADSVPYRPSVAARAFKAQAMTVAAVRAEASGDIEMFRRSKIGPLSAVPDADQSVRSRTW
jgi:hypothetical protein